MSSIFNDQSGGSSTLRNTFNSQYRKQFKQRWFYGGMADLLNSDEQSLDLRVSLGAFVGRKLILTDRTTLAVFSGAAGSRERYSPAVGRHAIISADSLRGPNK